MEEKVRQWFIERLKEHGVDGYRIAREYSVTIGGRRLRADIVIFAPRSTSITAIVECKAPSVELTANTIRQAAIYNSQIGARYLIVTNGTNTYIYDVERGDYMNELPASL